jgi:hypothetical protein
MRNGTTNQKKIAMAAVDLIQRQIATRDGQ